MRPNAVGAQTAWLALRNRVERFPELILSWSFLVCTFGRRGHPSTGCGAEMDKRRLGAILIYQHVQLRSARATRLRLTLALVSLATPAIALAYVDPGTGAYLVQGIMALIGAATFYVMRPIRFLRSLFSKRNKSQAQD